VAPGEKPPAKAATTVPAARATSAAQTAAAAPAQARPLAAPGAAAQISPKARRLAKELGVDIGQIQGTGPDGTITSARAQAVGRAKGGAARPEEHTTSA